METRDHIFFECGPSKRIWGDVMTKCMQKYVPTDWDSIVRQGLKLWKGKTLCATLCRLAWGASVYNIWKFQNDLKAGAYLLSEEKIMKKIKKCWEVPSRIVSGRKFNASAENEALCLNWGIHQQVLN
jgi:hypothetical protein